MYKQQCVWCGGGPCTTNNDNKCEPKQWLEARSNKLNQAQWEYGTCIYIKYM